MKAIVAALVLTLVAPFDALAQGAPVDDPEATLVSELIVVAPGGGPAWWRVSKGESVIWIMALPATYVPRDTTWDTIVLERRLSGAKAVLLPATVNFKIRGKMDDGVAGTLSPSLAARVARVSASMNRPASRYATPMPAVGVFRLQKDYANWAKLNADTMATIQAKARRAKVPVRRAKIDGGVLTPADLAPSRPGVASCLDSVLDSMEAPVEQYRAAAAGWARGDLRAALGARRDSWSFCENGVFVQGTNRRTIDAQLAAIEQALAQPGKTVAVAGMRQLLAEEGILIRLAAKGYDITYPTELGEGD